MLGDKDWLEDMHMYAALKLLKKQFPGMSGLQDTLLGSIMELAVVSTPFVQVLNDDSHFFLEKYKVIKMPHSWISRLKKSHDLEICTRPTCRSILGDGIRKKKNSDRK